MKHTHLLIIACLLAGGCQRGGVAAPASSVSRPNTTDHGHALEGSDTHSDPSSQGITSQTDQHDETTIRQGAQRQPYPTLHSTNGPIRPIRPFGPSPAAALAFTPPVALYAPPIDLTRDGRSHAAYLGYELQTLDTVWVRQDDQLRDNRWGNNSRFERRAISTRVQTRVR